ncbi:DnaJ-domain-containing protein [Viridothelium virens]|uniref:DnaJ-domain-containing protein n=1 Tax=Viridothelium virens TaxID=1048519 RepID=A0A6A6HI88_VIRVR|nr:DnaJ-domain-containing protein [Viridothelium virens]
MPSKSEDLIDDAPTSINPYEVLSLPQDASPSQIKTAYRRAALRHHPDKASPTDKDTAHTRFQEVAFAYAILSDPRRRSRYDTTGRTEESLDLDDDSFDWRSFYREQFAEVVTGAAVDAFRAEYQGSGKERAAVLAAYVKAKGDWDVVYEEVMLSDPVEDEERFRKIIEEAIERGEVKRFARYGRKGKEAEEENRALAALIRSKQQSRGDSFLANLEAKYAPKAKAKKAGKGKKRGSDEIDEEDGGLEEPPEEAFEAMGRRKGGKRKKGGDTGVQYDEELERKKIPGRKNKKAKI